MTTATPLALAAAAAAVTMVLGNGPGPVQRPAPVYHRVTLPRTMADDGGGTQLITAVAPSASSTTGTLSWWDRSDGAWRMVGTTSARFGAGGLVDGAARMQNTLTTPTGIYGLPFAFGNSAAPSGTALPYRPVTPTAYWCEDTASTAYNRWADPLPGDCRAGESEHLADYPVQYAHAVVIAFNYTAPVKGRGAGIFLHVNGSGATAGCVSVPASALDAVLAWLRPAAQPHIAIGTSSGTTAITRY